MLHLDDLPESHQEHDNDITPETTPPEPITSAVLGGSPNLEQLRHKSASMPDLSSARPSTMRRTHSMSDLHRAQHRRQSRHLQASLSADEQESSEIEEAESSTRSASSESLSDIAPSSANSLALSLRPADTASSVAPLQLPSLHESWDLGDLPEGVQTAFQQLSTPTHTPQQREIAQSLEHYVETGEYPKNRELAEAIRNGTAGPLADLGTPNARRYAITQFCLDVLNNQFEGTAARAGASVANSLARNLASVGLTTTLRQILAHYAGQAGEWSEHDREIVGLILGALPVALQAGGMIRDRLLQRDTTNSNTARALLAFVSLSAYAACAGTGNFAAVAPTLGAFAAYCLMRDGTQLMLPLKGQAPGIDGRATAGSALAYGVNQTAVNTAMTYGASPSGAGAKELEMGNGVKRGLFNTSGETVDEVVSSASQSWMQGVPFQSRLAPHLPTRSEVSDMFFNHFAARLALFLTSAQLLQVFSKATAGSMSESEQNNMGDFLGAAMLAVFYSMFTYSLDTKQRTRTASLEEGGGDAASHAAATPSSGVFELTEHGAQQA